MFCTELATIRVQEHILIVKVSTFIGWPGVVERFPIRVGGESSEQHNGVGEGVK